MAYKLYHANEIIKYTSGQLQQLLNHTKLPSYRLGDIILSFPQGLHIPAPVNTISYKYRTLFKGDTKLGISLHEGKDSSEGLQILMKLCDELECPVPDKNTLVVSLRLGDMIEGSNIKGDNLVNNGGKFSTPAGGVRHILSVNEIIEYAKKCNVSKIVFMGGSHNNAALGESVNYLKKIMTICETNRFTCMFFHSGNPDIDLAYMSHASHLLKGPGGFARIGYEIHNFRRSHC